MLRKNWHYLLLIPYLLLALLLTSLSQGWLNGIRAYSLRTPSMAPLYPTGSLLLVQPFPNYQIGDVITYFPADKNGKPNSGANTHRIYAVSSQGSEATFFTKGDANSLSDQFPVYRNAVIGKVIGKINYLGYLASFFKRNPLGRFLTVMPGLVIICVEFKRVTEALSISKPKVNR